MPTIVDRHPQDQQSGQHGPPTITVTVFAPRTTEPRIYTWAKSMRVGDAANEAAHDFGYEPGTPSFQNADGEVLDRNKPLAAAGIRDGDKVELVDVGGGV